MFRRHASKPEFDYVFDIVMLGDDMVGKTALLQRFLCGYFSIGWPGTINIELGVRTIQVDSKRCKLKIWDTPGQDTLKSIAVSCSRWAHGIIICFDITDMKSFQSVDTWLSESKRFCADNTLVYLVGTKADLKSKRVVTNEAIEAFSSKNNLSYIETSAKANENVEECFTTFARMLIARRDQMQMDHTSSDTDNKNINVTVHREPVSDPSARGYKIKENCAI